MHGALRRGQPLGKLAAQILNFCKKTLSPARRRKRFFHGEEGCSAALALYEFCQKGGVFLRRFRSVGPQNRARQGSHPGFCFLLWPGVCHAEEFLFLAVQVPAWQHSGAEFLERAFPHPLQANLLRGVKQNGVPINSPVFGSSGIRAPPPLPGNGERRTGGWDPIWEKTDLRCPEKKNRDVPPAPAPACFFRCRSGRRERPR